MSGGRMPSQVDGRLSLFDRFATAAEGFVARAWFFALCVLLIVVWAPSFLLVDDFDTYQLLVNTPTTIITFLLVALVQNSQHRADAAVQQKLNAVAAWLAALMAEHGGLERQTRELQAAVGLEDREGS